MSNEEHNAALPAQDAPRTETLTGFLIRFYWMGVGNAALFMTAVYILLQQEPGWGAADIVYPAVLLSMLAVRLIDIRRFHGQTVDGQPADMDTWLRYSVRLPAVAVLAWGVAHGLPYLWAGT